MQKPSRREACCAANGKRRDIRNYEQAQANIRVGERTHKSTWGDEEGLAVVEVAPDKVVLFSPLGPLTRDQLELIDIPASSTLLFRLLPKEPVGLDDSWSHDDATLAALLGLDAITQSDVKSVLRKIDGSTASIELSGDVSGAVRGVSSDIEMTGKYNFDLAHKRITWLALSIKESRAIGHAEPGFDVTARLRLAIVPDQECPQLAAEAIQSLPLDTRPGTTLLRLARSE